MNHRIVISSGDMAGIGPEVTLKALAGLPENGSQFLILGDVAHLQKLNRSLGTALELPLAGKALQTSRFAISQSKSRSLPEKLSAGLPACAEAAVDWLIEGADLCLNHGYNALVTAPVSKESIIRLGRPFMGQTEFLSELAGTDQTIMMLLGADDRGRWLRVALATTHLPLRQVADALKTEKIQLAIELASKACHDLGLARARVGVCGLNPHAGEGGEMGTEEITTIQPAISAAQSKGLQVVGPVAADTLFYYAFRGDYDAVVAMYHDQGLAPLKMIGFESGVNWTLGLPFIRTSPDHGTAYDIAGQGIASPTSMRAAIDLALTLAGSQKAG